LAAALASPVAASPLTCAHPSEGPDQDTVFGSVLFCESETNHYSTNYTSAFFSFAGGEVDNILSFDNVLQDFDLRMSAFFVPVGDESFLERIPEGFEPETFDTPEGPTWAYFRVEDLTDDPGSAPPQQGVDYAGFWTQEILWFGDGSYSDPQVLHDRRPLDTFTDVITVRGSFNPEGGPPFDPGIKGSADGFSDTTVVSTTAVVPEPGSLLLFGTGVAALVRRRYRK